MKTINPTRSRRFIVCTKDADDRAAATEFGASKDSNCASLMAYGLIKTYQADGFHNQRYFVIDAKTGETTEHFVDRNSGRSSTQPADPITRLYS